MKRWLTVIIIAAMLAVGWAVNLQLDRLAAPGAPEADEIRIAVLLYKGSDTLVSGIYGHMQAAAAELERDTGRQVYLAYLDAGDSQSTQNDQIERCIALGYDALCVNLVDRTDAAQIVDAARDADIPVVFFNREPVREDILKWDKVYYVGSDARLSAELQARLISDTYENDPRSLDMDGDGVIRYIMLEGESRHQDAMIRTEMTVQYLADSGMALERLDGGIANWSRTQAGALAEGYFETYGSSIELVICNNDDMALGVLDALEKLDIDFTNIVGIDGTEEALAAIAQRRMLGSVYTYPELHGRAVFGIAYALATGGSVSDAAEVDEDRCLRVEMHAVR